MMWGRNGKWGHFRLQSSFTYPPSPKLASELRKPRHFCPLSLLLRMQVLTLKKKHIIIIIIIICYFYKRVLLCYLTTVLFFFVTFICTCGWKDQFL